MCGAEFWLLAVNTPVKWTSQEDDVADAEARELFVAHYMYIPTPNALSRWIPRKFHCPSNHLAFYAHPRQKSLPPVGTATPGEHGESEKSEGYKVLPQAGCGHSNKRGCFLLPNNGVVRLEPNPVIVRLQYPEHISPLLP
jgi:hypothetical protein